MNDSEAGELAALLPPRYPFPLLDRVVECDEGRRLVAVSVVARLEPRFAGHFPGRPILPGVLICEALLQAGAVLARRCSPPPKSSLELACVRRVRFRRAVVPGDELRLEVSLAARRGSRWQFRGVASVSGEVAAEASLDAVERPLYA